MAKQVNNDKVDFMIDFIVYAFDDLDIEESSQKKLVFKKVKSHSWRSTLSAWTA